MVNKSSDFSWVRIKGLGCIAMGTGSESFMSSDTFFCGVDVPTIEGIGFGMVLSLV